MKLTTKWGLNLGFEGGRLLRQCLLFCLSCLMITIAHADAVQVLMQEAKSKAAKGDLSGAAVVYQEILEMDKNNEAARQGLKLLIVKGQAAEPNAESSEVMIGLSGERASDLPLQITDFSQIRLTNLALENSNIVLKQEGLWALAYLDKGDHGKAFRTIRLMIKQNPDHPLPYNLMGLAWQQIGELSKAKDAYQKSIALQPTFMAPRLNLVELNMYLGEFDEAEKELKPVLAQNPDDQRSCLLMAALTELQGKQHESKDWYHKVLNKY